jgi:hypothetical protein
MGVISALPVERRGDVVEFDNLLGLTATHVVTEREQGRWRNPTRRGLFVFTGKAFVRIAPGTSPRMEVLAAAEFPTEDSAAWNVIRVITNTSSSSGTDHEWIQ